MSVVGVAPCDVSAPIPGVAFEQLRLPEADMRVARTVAPRRLLTILDVAYVLAVGRTTVYELIGAGRLETVHIGRCVRIPVEAVDQLVAGLRISANPSDTDRTRP